MTSETLGILHNLSLLEGADPEVVARLAEVVVDRSYQPGEVILQEGSTGRKMYLIVEGQVEVVKGHGRGALVLARRGPGDFFGEMGLIEARPRFATVRALEPVRLLEFSEQELLSVLVQQPLLLYQTLRVLLARLRESDLKMVADLQEKNQELARAYRELEDAQAALVEAERLEREMELARDLQQSILPREFPSLPGFSCAARSQPARQVGGDFYDIIPLSDGRVGLVMADVSDKGMPAALFMALTRSLIRAEALRRRSPRKVLLRVHRLLLDMSRADKFVTVFYGVFDPLQRSLIYARAGHERPLLFQPGTGQCQPLPADGMFLGYLEEVSLEEASADLDPGDALILYTDGITDAQSPAGEFFGRERLCDTIRDAGSQSAQSLCDIIFERVEQFQAAAVQHDDMALLIMRTGAAG